MTVSPPLVSLVGIVHRYGGVLALDGIDLDVSPGDFLAVLGANGAGKSTLACIMAGATRPQQGHLLLEGRDAMRKAGRGGLVGDGIVLVPEGRRLFGQLSVEENLTLGAFGRRPREIVERLAEVYELMPKVVRVANGRPRH